MAVTLLATAIMLGVFRGQAGSGAWSMLFSLGALISFLATIVQITMMFVLASSKARLFDGVKWQRESNY